MKTRVLMIDDDAVPGGENALTSYMWYYADELRRRDCHVLEAIGPDQALEMLAKEKSFEVVVLDVMMPTGVAFRGNVTADRGLRTGVVLAEEIQQKYPRVPIVVLTNTANDGTLQALRANSSVKRILFKYEFTPSAFADEVANVLNERR